MIEFLAEHWLIVLPVAILSGWLVTLLERSGKSKQRVLSDDYLRGLNFLLNEEPDKAIDVFIKMLQVDSETVETHLALGNLFRRRGEVDRAIRIHQNLIARPSLDQHHRFQALLALANDYLGAGVLDRAEKLFLEIVESGQYVIQGVKQLLNIYEQEREWQKAVDTAKRLLVRGEKNVSLLIAHYYCELAEIQITNQLPDSAEQHLKEALHTDKSCARANLLLAKLNIQKGRYKQAIRQLKSVRTQNPDYFSEAILPIVEAFRALHKERELIAYLRNVLKNCPKIPIAIILSEQIKQWKGEKVAADFVADYVRKYPSVQGLHHLVNLHLTLKEGKAKEDLIILRGLTQKLLDEHPPYQCTQCGFASQALHWQCPTCRKWNVIKPAHVLEK